MKCIHSTLSVPQSFLLEAVFISWIRQNLPGSNQFTEADFLKGFYFSKDQKRLVQLFFFEWVIYLQPDYSIPIFQLLLRLFPREDQNILNSCLNLSQAHRAIRDHRQLQAIKKMVIAGLRHPNTIFLNTYWWDILRLLKKNRALHSYHYHNFLPYEIENIIKDAKLSLWKKMGVQTDSETQITTGKSEDIVVKLISPSSSYILKIFSGDREKLLLRIKLAKLLNSKQIKVPEFYLSGQTTIRDNNKSFWLVEEWIDGQWLETDELDSETLSSVLDNLGRNLKILHCIHPKGFGPILNSEFKTEFDTFTDWLDDYKARIIESLINGYLSNEYVPLINSAIDYLHANFHDTPSLCHGDLSQENIIMKDGKVSAIIDWGDLSGNDPAYDLAIFAIALDFEGILGSTHLIDKVLSGYGQVDATFFNRMLAHQTIFIAGFLQYLFSTTLNPLEDQFIQSLMNTLQSEFLRFSRTGSIEYSPTEG